MFFKAIFSHSSHHKFAENDNAKINIVTFFCNTPHMYRGQPTCWRAKGSKLPRSIILESCNFERRNGTLQRFGFIRGKIVRAYVLRYYDIITVK